VKTLPAIESKITLKKSELFFLSFISYQCLFGYLLASIQLLEYLALLGQTTRKQR
jgi:hypothetical protein